MFGLCSPKENGHDELEHLIADRHGLKATWHFAVLRVFRTILGRKIGQPEEAVEAKYLLPSIRGVESLHELMPREETRTAVDPHFDNAPGQIGNELE